MPHTGLHDLSGCVTPGGVLVTDTQNQRWEEGGFDYWFPGLRDLQAPKSS